MIPPKFVWLLSPIALGLASCASASEGERAAAPAAGTTFAMQELGRFDEPWAMDIDPGSGIALITERKGKLKLRMPDGAVREVSGAPKVDYGGQGGLGDVMLMPGETSDGPWLDGRTVYLSWAEAGDGDTRGAVAGRGTLRCDDQATCRLDGLKVIWRQQPKVTGRGHYSHRFAFSPDRQHLFISSGERQKMTPAQDITNNLGTIVRLLPDGTPAPGNPFADKPAPTNQIWSYGHRNVLGLAFDTQGQLWNMEHGPAGGDELNLVMPGRNYGWPVVSNGDHYDGEKIPRHSTRPDLAAPAISWNPVIAPGDFIVYSGSAFPEWRGEALFAAMKPAGIVRVAIDGDGAREVARYPTEHRMREIQQAPDGSIWVLEDGKESGAGRLFRLTPAAR